MDKNRLTTMERLRQKASTNQKQVSRGEGAYVNWPNLQDGNYVLFDIVEGTGGTRPNPKGYGHFHFWKTPAYLLCDEAGAVIRHHIAPEGAPEEDFFEIPCKGPNEKYNLPGTAVQHVQAREDGNSVGFYSAVRKVLPDNWKPKDGSEAPPKGVWKFELEYFKAGSEMEDLLWEQTAKTVIG